jgi:6-pyruvoyltetrahydropterin/6-carboxytetrahydropterin synthase
MAIDDQTFATVAKRFRWDSAHRLPKHEGACRNLHGHSYGMTVEFEGPVDDEGIVVDFKDIKNLVKPLVDRWDHATLIAQYDRELVDAVEKLGSRFEILPADSTAENMAVYVVDYILERGEDVLRGRGIRRISVRVDETVTSYAEVSRSLS